MKTNSALLPNPDTQGAVAASIVGDAYLRERWQPRPGDLLYLHLSDLRLALKELESDAEVKVLDYGCGSSPYRALFPNAEYCRADYLATDDLDYVVGEHQRIAESDGFFDVILSTQVVEHVARPAEYFAECHRLLKPGGLLICSTHGTWEEHGCPFDFQRWTAPGLQLILQDAGFAVSQVTKLTSGPRAVLFLVDRFLWELCAPLTTVFGALLWLLRRLLKTFRSAFHRQCDRYFANCRVIARDPDVHVFYLALLATARKPAGL